VRRLGFDVGFAISREALGQDAFHVGEPARRVGVRPEIVAKQEIVPPQRTACYDQVHVVRARLPPAKELSARHAPLAAVFVAGALDSGDAVLERRITGPSRRQVEDRLGAHAGDRGAADVFECQRERAALAAYPISFGGEEGRPANVVLDDADRPRLETETVRHGAA
jgi:hypothetical protein